MTRSRDSGAYFFVPGPSPRAGTNQQRGSHPSAETCRVRNGTWRRRPVPLLGCGEVLCQSPASHPAPGLHVSVGVICRHSPRLRDRIRDQPPAFAFTLAERVSERSAAGPAALGFLNRVPPTTRSHQPNAQRHAQRAAHQAAQIRRRQPAQMLAQHLGVPGRHGANRTMTLPPQLSSAGRTAAGGSACSGGLDLPEADAESLQPACQALRCVERVDDGSGGLVKGDQAPAGELRHEDHVRSLVHTELTNARSSPCDLFDGEALWGTAKHVASRAIPDWLPVPPLPDVVERGHRIAVEDSRSPSGRGSTVPITFLAGIGSADRVDRIATTTQLPCRTTGPAPLANVDAIGSAEARSGHQRGRERCGSCSNSSGRLGSRSGRHRPAAW